MALKSTLLPEVAVVESIREETPTIKTFRVVSPNGGKPIEHMPGQCAMISVPPVGEAIFSITSSPTEKDYLDFSIVKTGTVTNFLHDLEEGFEVGIRGPMGNHFPVEEVKGKDLLFIGGGIGLAPLRSFINYCFDNRDDYGKIDILYGARTPDDMIQKKDIHDIWPKQPNTDVYLTVDKECEGWDGKVALAPHYCEELGFSPENKVAITCGPPIMIKFILEALQKMGFSPDQIVTTLELRMKCGVGKCGRCNIGDKYVCIDGPVFTYAQLLEMPPEY